MESTELLTVKGELWDNYLGKGGVIKATGKGNQHDGPSLGGMRTPRMSRGRFPKRWPGGLNLKFLWRAGSDLLRILVG